MKMSPKSPNPNSGVLTDPELEKMLRFRRLPASEKLRWLEEMRCFLRDFQPAAARERMQQFRRGEL